MPLDLDIQKDLHEAFRLLYDDEEDFNFDADWDEDDDAIRLPEEEEAQVEPEIRSTKYSKKRLQALLDALIPSDPTYQPAQKRRRLLSSRPDDTVHPTTTLMQAGQTPFAPNSTSSYRSRLLSFTLPTYSSKPETLRPQNVARYGWKNSGRERLQCDTCGSAWVIKGLNDPKLAKARARLVELYEEQLIRAHRKGCPWRIQQSPASVHYQLLAIHPPLSSQLAPVAKELDANYLRPEETVSSLPVQVVGGLPSTELSNLLESLQSVTTPTESALDASSTGISQEAANLSFFGWRPYRPLASSSKVAPDQLPAAVPDVLHCAICDRKVGLYNFRETNAAPLEAGDGPLGDKRGSKRALDTIREHREFCPIKVYADPLATDGSQQDKIREEAELSIERPWWRSAVILRSTGLAGLQDANTGPIATRTGTGLKMTKQEVLTRLKDILGEKDTRLNLRGRL